MSELPVRIEAGSGQTLFRLRPDLHAIRQDATAPVRPGARAIIADDAGAVYVVCGGEAPDGAPEAGPVFQADAGGPLAVPTGRVLVRLEEGHPAEGARDRLAAAGFVVERTLPYAPHAAWLRPASGGVAGALAGLDALRRLRGIVHVEPQVLLERAAKHT